MKNAKPLLAAALSGLLLAACATTPTVYRAQLGAPNDVG